MLPTVLIFLCLLVLVNGWTDAPNAITAPVASGVMSFTRAALLAAVCCLGGVLWSAGHGSVARTMYDLTDLGPHASAALAAALSSAVLWGVLAWRFGLPTSESHALISGLSGAALALGKGHLHLRPLIMIGAGLILSLALGVLLSHLAVFWLDFAEEETCRRGLMLGTALTGFLHGAQDGQKFLALLALALDLEKTHCEFLRDAPLWCGLLMGIGTLIGGRRIVRTMGEQMVKLTPRTALASDAGSAVTLLLCTLSGLPVSTTHIRAAALLGAGSSPDGRIAGMLGLVCLLTFPVCGGLSYWLTRLLTGA